VGSDMCIRDWVGMFLVRRGFDPETVRSAIRAAGSPAATDELS
jgi:SOS response regulatory protein OraA/RecX